jgi:hypothetical protein
MILFEKLIVTQIDKKYPAFFMESKGSLLYSQKPPTQLYPEPAKSRRGQTIRNLVHKTRVG